MRLVDLVARYLARVDGPRPSGTRQQAPDSPRSGATPPALARADWSSATPGLPPLISDWPAEWRDVFEERAGIMEFDADLARVDAESRAAYWTRRLYRSRDLGASGNDGGDGHDASG